ncbi:MAG: 6-phosphogluconolactonase [Spirochaetes bacterium]|jgi:6-phosphogluconolactonase|nr:6-phosphogluconolactonase [Spirochaetota bacterium]
MKDIVVEEPPRLYELVLSELESMYQLAVKSRGCFTLALSGGSTPKPLYKKLAESGVFDWRRVYLFLVDERFTPLNSKDSNYRMMNDVLFSVADNPVDHIFFVDTNLENADIAACEYENSVNDFFNKKEFDAVLDAVVLGMGDDGHTASVFPGDSLLYEKEKIIVSTDKEYNGYYRISMTIDFLNRSRALFFLVTGMSKQESAFRVIQKHSVDLPAAHISGKNLHFFLDKAAASLLI